MSGFVRDGAEHFDLSFPGDEVYAGETVTANVRAVLPGVILPVFYVSFQAVLTWNTRSCTLRGMLRPGENSDSFTFVPEERGEYKGSVVTIFIRDILGFTVSSVEVESRNTLMVLTESCEPSGLPRVGGSGGEISAIRKAVTRSDELLEVRKYYPGDDIRRVNWKMFAHLGELYIRIGEEVPPPNAAVLIALDTALPPAFQPGTLEVLLDRAVAGACGCALFFLDRGYEVWVSFSGSPGARSIVGREREEIFRFFARAWWSDAPVPVPGNGPVTTCLFSFPSSPGNPGFLSSVRGKKKVFLPSAGIIPGDQREPAVKRFLFRGGRERAGMPPAGVYRQALEEEYARLSGHGREVEIAEY